MLQKEKSRELIAEGKFLTLHEIRYTDYQGSVRVWESAGRKNEVQAVSMVVWLNPSNRLIFIKQYRPPAQSYCLEFPAGLIDKGETVETAAIRELKEETGYTGEITSESPIAFSSAGMSSEKVTLCIMEVDETLDKNKNPEQNLDDGEHIDIHLIRQNKISYFIKKEIENGTSMTSRMIAYLLGQGLLGV